MSVENIIGQLKGAVGCNCYEPLPMSMLHEWEDRLGIQFPDSYREFLTLTNGCETNFGHYRLFGFDKSRSIDIVRWNEQDCWKYAWDGEPDKYWCFGETAFGDQYAFLLEELVNRNDAPVYFLGHISMTHTGAWSGSFATFLEKEFLRSTVAPYWARDIHAIQTIGPLDLSIHVMMIPSLLFRSMDDDGADADLQLMPARAAMICNGDLGVQWDAGCEEQKTVERVEPYVDGQGRARMRIIWADD